MGLKLIEGPATKLVSLDTAKSYLRVDHSSEDTVLNLMLESVQTSI